jgi:hypothetical protein
MSSVRSSDTMAAMTTAAGVPGAPPSPDPAGPPVVGAPTKKDIKPSAIWYWIGAGLLVVSLFGGFTLMIVGIAGVIDAPADHQRISVPGERTLQLPAAGTYEIYGETSEYTYASTTLEPPRLEVKDSSGATVPVTNRAPTSRSSYFYQGYEAFEFATISVPAPGAYTFTVREAVVTDDPLPPTTTSTTSVGRPTTSRRATTTSPFFSTVPADRVAVGQDLGGRTGALIGGGVALMGIGSIAGIIVLIVVGVRRSGSRKRLFPPPARPAFGAYPGTGGYGPYGGPGYGGPGYGGPGYGGPGYGAPGYGVPGAPAGRPASYGPYGAPPGAAGAGPWGAPPGAAGPMGAPAPSGPPTGPPVGPPGAPPPPFASGPPPPSGNPPPGPYPPYPPAPGEPFQGASSPYPPGAAGPFSGSAPPYLPGFAGPFTGSSTPHPPGSAEPWPVPPGSSPFVAPGAGPGDVRQADVGSGDADPSPVPPGSSPFVAPGGGPADAARGHARPDDAGSGTAGPRPTGPGDGGPGIPGASDGGPGDPRPAGPGGAPTGTTDPDSGPASDFDVTEDLYPLVPDPFSTPPAAADPASGASGPQHRPSDPDGSGEERP